MADETKQHDTPVLRLAEPRAEDAGIVQRYERQLGLPLGTLSRLLGPTLVKSVALTGSDPSFPMGTDVAVLLETDQPAVLANRCSASASNFPPPSARRQNRQTTTSRGCAIPVPGSRAIGRCPAISRRSAAQSSSPIRVINCSDLRRSTTGR